MCIVEMKALFVQMPEVEERELTSDSFHHAPRPHRERIRANRMCAVRIEHNGPVPDVLHKTRVSAFSEVVSVVIWWASVQKPNVAFIYV